MRWVSFPKGIHNPIRTDCTQGPAPVERLACDSRNDTGVYVFFSHGRTCVQLMNSTDGVDSIPFHDPSVVSCVFSSS